MHEDYCKEISSVNRSEKNIAFVWKGWEVLGTVCMYISELWRVISVPFHLMSLIVNKRGIKPKGNCSTNRFLGKVIGFHVDSRFH